MAQRAEKTGEAERSHKDVNQIAASIVSQVTEGSRETNGTPDKEFAEEEAPEKTASNRQKKSR